MQSRQSCYVSKQAQRHDQADLLCVDNNWLMYALLVRPCQQCESEHCHHDRVVRYVPSFVVFGPFKPNNQIYHLDKRNNALYDENALTVF